MKGHFHRTLALLSFLVAGNLRNVADGFSSGAPSQACSTLTPDPGGHQAAPQAGVPPYEVDLSALDDGNSGFEYEPGATYTCMLM